MPSKEIECVTVLLAVSDDEERGRLERILRHSSWSVHPVATLREATAVLQEEIERLPLNTRHLRYHPDVGYI